MSIRFIYNFVHVSGAGRKNGFTVNGVRNEVKKMLREMKGAENGDGRDSGGTDQKIRRDAGREGVERKGTNGRLEDKER